MTDERLQSLTGADKFERCILVGLDEPESRWSIEESLDELARLASSAGAVECARVIQSRRAPSPSTYVGKGKVDEVRELCEQMEAALVIFDDELSPGQARNIAEVVGARVVDRTQLILDIFAQRARTKEGKLQVELAQLRYSLPRLVGLGSTLSRLGAGIGTRGPGETKLEVDRRRIRSRMSDVRRELEDVRRHRSLQREGRQTALAPVAALVGYTNAGKSTLLNRLTGAEAYTDDRLFATLDPTIRQAIFPDGGAVLLVDTVGFIRKLPHELIAAFRATLEEVVEADVLVHVIDVSSPDWYDQALAVSEVLGELGAIDKPTVTALNKVDVADRLEVEALLRRTPDAVAVSALAGEGFEELLAAIQRLAPDPTVRWEFVVPYADAHVASWIHEHGKVLSEEYAYDGIHLEAELRRPLAGRVETFKQNGDG